MVKGIHVLLSYACTYQCDHCFLHCSPSSGATFTALQLERLMDQAEKVASIKEFYFEGGEPFMFHPILRLGLEMATARGFSTGVVTNGYFATTVEDAKIWLAPLKEAGLGGVSVSDDELHGTGTPDSGPKRIMTACHEMGIPATALVLEMPRAKPGADGTSELSPGGVRFRGRAAETLARDMPTRPWSLFDECPDEDFVHPSRVHVDALGAIQACQGVSLGNIWQKPLAEILEDYDPHTHPICGPLIRGGPAELIRHHGLEMEDEYVDQCHACYEARKQLVDKYPDAAAPGQAYGIRNNDQ